ncbi:MAG TPA: ROK family protein [Balneolaceae bacterium]|nr:ROK family protein [Balneolaceae bacterium]
MNIFDDQRIVLTLDAGGTNFVFSALRGGEEVVDPVSLPAYADNLDKSLKNIIVGFEEVRDKVSGNPVAISFAFPGPADYPAGIIDNVGNLPAYAGGVALGPMLEDKFDLPVFINNDGDLFAYGEAMAGLLPEVNRTLKEKNIPKKYKNLFGVTIGTGFGGGIVINNQLARGDNSASGEIWITRNFEDDRLTAEEGVSIRAILQAYRENVSDIKEELSPKDIYDIAKGNKKGDQKAAIYAFEKMGSVLGEALANAITLIDGVMVIGGGISGAYELFMPTIMEQLNGKNIMGYGDKPLSRLVANVYNLEDEQSAEEFYHFESKEITVPFSNRKIPYVPETRLPIGISRLGTSEATALGAYAFALNNL